MSTNLSRPSLTAKVAALFRSNPDRWIDSEAIAAVGGRCAWRTRIADARRHPHNLEIRNRVRRVTVDGKTFTVSEYRHVPDMVKKSIQEVTNSEPASTGSELLF